MSEELEKAESAPEAPGAGADPVAVALALGGASQAQADAFLRKQEAFVDDQRHHLQAQFARAAQLDLAPSERAELTRLTPVRIST